MPIDTLTTSKPRYEGLKVTREEYLDLPEDGFKYDMVKGVLTMAPSPNFEHNEIGGEFNYLLRQYLHERHNGKVVYEMDVFLPDGEDVLRPDISFILNENMVIVKTHIHGTPDLVCEILSDSTRDRDLMEKADRYLKNGVKEYWIIDPKNKSMELWLNQKSNWEKQCSDKLSSSLLKGFTVNKEDIL